MNARSLRAREEPLTLPAYPAGRGGFLTPVILFVVEPVELVGERPESVGSLWATRMLSIGCPHGPKGSGRSEGLVHKSKGQSRFICGRRPISRPRCNGPMSSDLHTET